MDIEHQVDRRRRQVERLLRFPGVGALAAPAITSNLGVPPGALDSVLETLEEDGVLVRTEDGRFAAPTPGERG
jgi:DNA-binding HxlR family transcriptional regulator